MKSVFLSAGHSNTDPGAVAHGRREADVAVDFRNKVAFYLQREGVPHELDATGTANLPLAETVRKTKARAGLELEFHCNASSAATYQGYLQAFYDRLVALLPGVTVELICFRPHPNDPASNATALANVRTGFDDFGAANPNVTIIDTDAYGLEPDDVHYDAAASKAMGILLHD